MNTHSSEVEWGRGFILGVCIGSAVGAALALLYAPTSGKELRVTMRDKTNSLLSETGELIEKTKARVSTSLNGAKGKITEQQARIAGAVNAGVTAYNEAEAADTNG
jgi:gas vesicle protein